MLADHCPHRFVPLGRGKRVGDTLRCGYHGLGFGADGRCVHTAFTAQVPDAAVATMPVAARHGAAEQADSALIRDFAFVAGGAEVVCEHFSMKAGTEFIVDNLMDVSHAEFIHIETFGANGSPFGGEHKVETDDTCAIWNKWDMRNIPPPAWPAPMVPAGGRVNQWIHIRWHVPASMALFIGLTHADSGTPVIPEMANPHIITPETATTSHYFFSRSPGNAAREMAMRVFLEEDEPLIEAAEAGLGGEDFWAARPLILPSDAGAVRVRRRLMQLRRPEAGLAEAAE